MEQPGGRQHSQGKRCHARAGSSIQETVAVVEPCLEEAEHWTYRDFES